MEYVPYTSSHQRWQLQRLFSEMKELLSFDLVSHLPGELAEKIFTYLDPPSLCTAAHCCRRWREMTNNDTLWWERERERCDSAITSRNTVFAIAAESEVMNFCCLKCYLHGKTLSFSVGTVLKLNVAYIMNKFIWQCIWHWWCCSYPPQHQNSVQSSMVKVQMSPLILVLHLWKIALPLVPMQVVSVG